MTTATSTKKSKGTKSRKPSGLGTITKIVNEQKNATEYYGELVYWDIPSAQSMLSLKQALTNAGLDVDKLRNIGAGTAFSRVAHKLSDDGFFDKLDRQGKEIVFQLTEAAVIQNSNNEKEIQFNRKAFLRLDTETGTVTCPSVPDLALKIETMIRDIQSQRIPAEITGLIKNFLEDNTDVFPIRERNSGVYFAPEISKQYLDRIAAFLFEIGGTLHRIPMVKDSSTRQSAAAAIRNGIKNMIADQNDLIDRLDMNCRADTLKKQFESIQKMEAKMKGYQFILEDEIENLQSALADSKKKVQAKIDEVKSFKEQSLLCTVKVQTNKCLIWGYSVSKMAKYLRHTKQWELEKIARLCVNLFGRSRVSAPSIMAMACVNKGYDDLSITDEQYRQLDDMCASSDETPKVETIDGGLIVGESDE